MTLGVSTEAAAFQSICANEKCEMVPITVQSGAGIIVKGSVLGAITATGKYAELDTASTSGCETARGLLAENVDATSAEVLSQMWAAGKFKNDEITWPDGITEASKGAAILTLQASGILLDVDVADVIAES